MFRGRPTGQRDEIVGRRLRLIESGLYDAACEDFARGKLDSPPVGAFFDRKMQDRMVQRHPVKDRFALTFGDATRGESGWDIPDLVEWDYSNLNQAAAGHALGTILGIMPGSNAPAIGSPDAIGPSLAAASGNRQIGTGINIYAAVLSCWVFARTAAGAIYVPANTPTLGLVACSAFGTNQGTDALTAATTLNNTNLPAFWNQFALTVPTSRNYPIGGALASGVAAVFYGDVLFSDLNTSVALNVQGNHLVMFLEMC